MFVHIHIQSHNLKYCFEEDSPTDESTVSEPLDQTYVYVCTHFDALSKHLTILKVSENLLKKTPNKQTKQNKK